MALTLSRHNWMTIDPGLGSTGWAVWPNTSIVCRPLRAGLAHQDKKVGDFLRRAQTVSRQIAAIAKEHEVGCAWTEWPVFYANSPGGHMAAATGDLLKICSVAAACAGALDAMDVPCHPVLVPEWKGQLPKPVVNDRIKKILGEAECKRMGLKADMWDAVGIGLWLRKLL